MTEKVVVTSSLCKKYVWGDITVDALRDIDLEVEKGDFISIYGPSGAGKTTLLNIIGGIDKPTSGKVFVFGQDLGAYEEDFLATFRCAYVGFVFQAYNLISTLTAIENVAFAVELAGWSKEIVRKRSETLLRQVGLEHRTDHLPDQLSGGEQQRVAFARALANNPPLLLVDEPTGNLDTETGLAIVRILANTKIEGTTVIAATHDKRILELSNRKFVLHAGRLQTNE